MNTLKVIFFFIGALIGYAFGTMVPGVPEALAYGMALIGGLVPAAVI